jgi:hypothetical protein
MMLDMGREGKRRNKTPTNKGEKRERKKRKRKRITFMSEGSTAMA